MKPHPSPLVKTYPLDLRWTLIPGDALPDGRDVGPEGQADWCLYWDVESRRNCLPGNGQCSVSANVADGEGECCDCSGPIPLAVLDNLDPILEQLAEAGLY